MKKKMKLLKELTDANGAPGNEIAVRKVMEKHLKNVADSIETDKLGSFIAIKKNNNKDNYSPKVMVAGHMDEVSFMLKKIDNNGFIKFQALGGWWGHVVLGQEFNIITEKNKIITGIVGSIPPHLLEGGERERVVKLENMFIDIGVKDKEEAEKLGLEIGDMIVPKVDFEQMGNKNYLKAKAFDNRIGCGIAIEVMKNLSNNCPVDLYSVGTVQEEVGLRGAITSANKVKPDIAFVVDVTLAGDMPRVSGVDGKLGGGPLIILMDAMTLGHKGLIKLAMKVAKDLNMNVNFEIMPKGGTDAGRIHTSSVGVPTIGFAIASRYIHSHCSMIHYKDYKNLIKLITEICKRINWNLINNFN